MVHSIQTFFNGATEIGGKKISHKAIIATTVVVVMIVVIIFLVCNTPNRSGLYKDIAWGTSWDEVLKILGQDKTVSDLVENDSKLAIIHNIKCPEENEDINITSILSFDENRNLIEVGLMILKEDGSQYSDDELIHELCYRFNDLYGNYTEDDLNYVWLTDESEISFMYISDGFFLLQYADINSVE